MFWALVIIVTLKYITLIMRADNNGEGGILALTALVSRGIARHERRRWWLVGFGIFGAAMFYGDGMITPAISVLSAVEGLEIVTPALHQFVVPVTLVIIMVLFGIQKHGTASVGMFFGPVMCLYFVVIAVLGAIEVAQEPAILAALNPIYALRFFANEPSPHSSPSAPSCWPSPAPKRSTPTWGTSAARRSAARGSSSCCRRSCSTTSARAR